MKDALIGVAKGILAIFVLLLLLIGVIGLAPIAVSLFEPLRGLLGWAGPLKGVVLYVLLYVAVMAAISLIGNIIWLRAFDDDDDIGPGPYYTP